MCSRGPTFLLMCLKMEFCISCLTSSLSHCLLFLLLVVDANVDKEDVKNNGNSGSVKAFLKVILVDCKKKKKVILVMLLCLIWFSVYFIFYFLCFFGHGELSGKGREILWWNHSLLKINAWCRDSCHSFLSFYWTLITIFCPKKNSVIGKIVWGNPLFLTIGCIGDLI